MAIPGVKARRGKLYKKKQGTEFKIFQNEFRNYLKHQRCLNTILSMDLVLLSIRRNLLDFWAAAGSAGV